jgi:hypothetical protein
MAAKATGSNSLQEAINDMPLVDDDAPEILSDDEESVNNNIAPAGGQPNIESIESVPFSDTVSTAARSSNVVEKEEEDMTEEEKEEKERLIQQIMELQNTLDG